MYAWNTELRAFIIIRHTTVYVTGAFVYDHYAKLGHIFNHMFGKGPFKILE